MPPTFLAWRTMHCGDWSRAQVVVQSASQCLRSTASNYVTCWVVVVPMLMGELLPMFSVQSETHKATWYWTTPGAQSTLLLRQRIFLSVAMGHELRVAHFAMSGHQGPTSFSSQIECRLT